jgi:hypothetical protein
MRLLTLLFVLFVALPALGQARFMQIGDPQLGRGCQGTPYTEQPLYANLTTAQCIHRQARQLKAAIDYGVARNADFFWIMGDMVEAGGTAQAYNSIHRTKLGDIMSQYPNETFYITPGNHDYNDNNCADYRVFITNMFNCTDSYSGNTPDGANNCTTSGTMTADQDSGTPDGYCDDFSRWSSCRSSRVNLWDSWVVNNVHFFNTSAALWGWTNDDCTGLTAQCMDRTDSAGTACSSDGDKEGLGTSTTCNPDEVCEDFAGYDDDMKTAFDTWVDDYIAARAAGDANVIMAAGHYPWIYRDGICGNPTTDCDAAGDPCECCDGAGSGTFCSSGLDYDITNVKTWRWGMDVKLATAGVGTSATNPFYFLTGHVHKFLCWGVLDSGGAPPADLGYLCEQAPTGESGLTTENGVYYQVYTVSGSGDPSFDEVNDPPEWFVPLGNFFWEVDADGTVTRTFVSAGGQLGGGR